MSHQTDMHGNAVHPSSQHMGGQRLEGKLQSAVGTMIGSQTLKAKGQAKEREAVALKAQAAELNEAEHYEQPRWRVASVQLPMVPILTLGTLEDRTREPVGPM